MKSFHTMRSRYSRRIYSMKFGTESSDYIDDDDIKFLENLISLHKNFKDNFKKKTKFDISLLSPRFHSLYEKISNKYPIVKISENNEELYNNVDLQCDGEEVHIRNIRDQIINYLDNKKHQIFTNHRVEFFIKIALHTKCENLRDICREMIFNLNSKQASNNNNHKKPVDKSKFLVPCTVLLDKIENHEIPEIISNDDQNKVNEIILNNYAKMDTLLLPYIKMVHPKSNLDYDIADKMILDSLQNHVDLLSDNTDGDESGPETVEAVKNNYIMPNGSLSPSMPTLLEHLCIIDSNKIPANAVLPPPLLASSSNKSEGCHNEIIEISDEETENEPEESLFTYKDIDEMIDYLIHRCTIQPDQHPSLLRDHQMQVELNGFLLFVNFGIRFSLRYPLDAEDRRIFDCIFISSIIVGLTCLVYINDDGINFERLTDEAYRIVSARLKSVQVPVKKLAQTGHLYTVLINPDIARLVHLTLFYVQGYHETGQLAERQSQVYK